MVQQVQNPTQVVDSDTNIVFKLIEDIVPEPEDLAQTTNSAASPQQQQLQTQILNIKAEAEANTAGFMMTMSMLKQASSKSWLSLKLWLLEFDIVVRGKSCKKFEQKLHGNMGDHGYRF